MTEMTADAPPQALVLPWNVVVSVGDLEALRAGAPEAGVTVDSRADLRRAERHLLASLVKDTEGFMSRHFERKISLAVSRLLAGTSVSPNAMTLFSLAVGLVGAAFFLRPTPASETTGALLFLLHSILDGCDGELARLKFQESRWGGLLDFWSDNVVHAAVFAAMAVGWSRSLGQAWPLALGASAVAGTFASAYFVYRRTMTRPREGPLYTSVATEGETIALPRRRRGIAPGLHLSRSDTVRPRQGPLVPRARGRRRPGFLSHADGDRLRGTASTPAGVRAPGLIRRSAS